MFGFCAATAEEARQHGAPAMARTIIGSPTSSPIRTRLYDAAAKNVAV